MGVSIHAPTKGATDPAVAPSPHRCFNPRSHEGSDSYTQAAAHSSQCFNPRSHEGSDQAAECRTRSSIVSIHAPTKGATQGYSDLMASIDVSIHAPTKGATIGGGRNGYNCRFQSTLPRRERQFVGVAEKVDTQVSIHAPTKGATATPSAMIQPCSKFQSTLPRRERHNFFLRICQPISFNPRSHEGSDRRHRTPKPFHHGFQSTLPRRERLVLKVPRLAQH